MNKFKLFLPYNDSNKGYILPGTYKHNEITLSDAHFYSVCCIETLEVEELRFHRIDDYRFTRESYYDEEDGIIYMPKMIHINYIPISDIANYLKLHNFHKDILKKLENLRPFENIVELNKQVPLPYNILWQYCFPRMTFNYE